MHYFRCGRGYGQNFLIDVLLGCLHQRDGLRQLVLLAGELILIAGKLLYASPHDGKIERRGFERRLQFRGSHGRAGRGGG